MSDWVVLKFGGTSVASAERWATIRQIAAARRAEGLRPLLVCSAITGVSDTLERLLSAALAGAQAPLLAALRARHVALADALGVPLGPEVAAQLDFLERMGEGVALVGEISARSRARVMATGELMSTRLGAAWLASQGVDVAWLDARELLRAEDDEGAPPARRYLSATCAPGDDDALRALLDARGAAVTLTQGFIAARPDTGETVLLGRGGSDTSAALFAARLGAARCEIWTDVRGMYTADPRTVPGARLLRRLDYEEALEIATSGAAVLHPRCIRPVRLAGIPLRIHCTSSPDAPGTTISRQADDAGPGFKAVSARRGVALVSMKTVGMWQQVGFLADVFACFRALGLSVDQVATSEAEVTVSLDPSANPLDPATLERLCRQLSRYCEPRVLTGCATVSLVGRGIPGPMSSRAGASSCAWTQAGARATTPTFAPGARPPSSASPPAGSRRRWRSARGTGSPSRACTRMWAAGCATQGPGGAPPASSPASQRGCPACACWISAAAWACPRSQARRPWTSPGWTPI